MRDVNVSSPGMTDKTMGKFYSVAAFVKPVFNKSSSRRDYGLNAGHMMECEKYLFSVLKNISDTARKYQ